MTISLEEQERLWTEAEERGRLSRASQPLRGSEVCRRGLLFLKGFFIRLGVRQPRFTPRALSPSSCAVSGQPPAGPEAFLPEDAPLLALTRARLAWRWAERHGALVVARHEQRGGHLAILTRPLLAGSWIGRPACDKTFRTGVWRPMPPEQVTHHLRCEACLAHVSRCRECQRRPNAEHALVPFIT